MKYWEIIDEVIRRVNALSAGLNRLKGLSFAETPLSAISRFSWSPESPEARPLFQERLVKMVPRSARIWSSQPQMKGRLQMNFPDQPIAMSEQVHTYTELRQQIHDDLRIQHPEWVQPNGESPMCDSYEARLMELLN